MFCFRLITATYVVISRGEITNERPGENYYISRANYDLIAVHKYKIVSKKRLF